MPIDWNDFPDSLSANIKSFMGSTFEQYPDEHGNNVMHGGLSSFIDSVAVAMTPVWQDYFNGLSILPLTTLGGRGAANGADLNGVISLLTPGCLLTATPFFGIRSAYNNPFDDATTDYVAALLSALDQAMSLIGTMYATTYLKMPLRMDGISGWVSGSPPAPGPYTQGPATSGQALSSGISTSLPVQIAMAVTIKNYMVSFLPAPFSAALWYTSNSNLEMFMFNMARGIAKQWFDVFIPGVVFSGGTPVGICYPGGSVTAVTSGVQLDD